ncbi:MAG: lipopolysaccharide kinase InaA family protein [Candidatus Binataceae bacterium]
MRKHLLYARTPQWRALIERADSLMKSDAFRRYKRTGKIEAGFVSGPGGAPAFLKRVATHSWFAGIAERIRGSRASRALAGAAMLGDGGFAHPTPLAAMEIRALGAVRETYVLSEALNGATIFSEYMLGRRSELARDYRRRKRIADAVAAEVRRLHDAGIFTTDLQETNILLEEQPGGLRIYFVDLEDFRRADPVPWRIRLTNLVHLDRSVGRFVCRAGRLAFLYSYLGRTPARAQKRKIVAELMTIRAEIERRWRRRHPGNDGATRRKQAAAPLSPPAGAGK